MREDSGAGSCLWYLGKAPGLGEQQKQEREEDMAQSREKPLDAQEKKAKPAFVTANMSHKLYQE